MINPHDIVARTPLRLARRAQASGAASGVCDTEGADWALIRFCIGQSVGTARLQARCCSAAATLYASATAFGTAIDLSGVNVSNRQYAYLVNMRTAGKRFIRVRISATDTTTAGVLVDLHWNDTVPPTDITGSAPFSSFFAFTVIE